MTQNDNTKMICEGAICIALSIALSFFKIPTGLSFGGFGGSIDLVMAPLVIFSFRNGSKNGFLSGFAFGCIKYFIAGGFAINLASFFLDYSIAYAFVGFSGLFKGTNIKNLPLAAFVGAFGRFIIHFISGITVYAEYMPESFMNMSMKSAFIYSALYNGTYMLPNTIIAIVSCYLLIPLLKKI